MTGSCDRIDSAPFAGGSSGLAGSTAQRDHDGAALGHAALARARTRSGFRVAPTVLICEHGQSVDGRSARVRRSKNMLSAIIDASTRRGEPAAFSNDDARWEAVRRRDRSADGAFFYAVRTTGVYCQPSCAARPRRQNVVFHATAAEAERAGLRPWCRPSAAAPDRS
jgi:hypothetical protein